MSHRLKRLASCAVCFDVYDRDGVGAINLEQLKAVLSCVMRNEERSVEQYESESLDEEGRRASIYRSMMVILGVLSEA